MKLYLVGWSDPSNGRLQRWFPSKAAAQKGIKEIKADYEDDKDWTHQLEIKSVNVPTGKDELIEWLNKWLDTDNG